MTTLTDSTVRALGALHSHGARFVLLRSDTKIAFERGWIDRDQLSLGEVIQHLQRGGALGIEPASLSCCAVDVDGGKRADGTKPTAAELTGLADSIIDWIGARPFARLASASGAKTGKRHLWYAFPDSTEAPLGTRLEKGQVVARKCSKGLMLDGEGTSFDTRCANSYVRCDHGTYLVDLAAAFESAQVTPQEDASRLAEIDARFSGKAAKIAAPVPTMAAAPKARPAAPAKAVPAPLPEPQVWQAKDAPTGATETLASAKDALKQAIAAAVYERGGMLMGRIDALASDLIGETLDEMIDAGMLVEAA